MSDDPRIAAVELVHEYIGMTRRFAVKAARKRPHLADDFESDCLLALWGQARSFDPNRGVKFSARLAKKLDRVILDTIRRLHPRGYGQSSNITRPEIYALDGNAESSKSQRDDERDNESDLDYIVAKLPERERPVILCIYRDGMSYNGTAKILGITKSRVSRIHTKSMDRIREDARTINQISNHPNPIRSCSGV